MKKLTMFIVAISMLITLTSCKTEKNTGSSSTDSKASSASSVSSSGEQADGEIWSPGEDSIPESARKLPDLDIKNKTVKILTHGGEVNGLEDFKAKYGINIEYDIAVSTEKVSRLQTLVAAGTPPDLFWSIFMPTLITRNYVQPADPYMDFDSEIWTGIKESLSIFKWGGKNYFVVPRFGKNYVLWYNKDIFEDYGMETPTDLYKQGKWDWDAMYNMAKELTVDANKDGTPEQWGIEMGMAESFVITSGKSYISFVNNATAVNNIKSAEIARGINFYADLTKNGYLYTGGPGIDAFANQKVAMSWGHLWYRAPYKKLIQSESVMLAPVPKDPKADKHYTISEAEAYYFVRGAKNPEGAAAFLNALRISSFDPAKQKAEFDRLVANGEWNSALEDALQESHKIKDSVYNNWATFDLGDQLGNFFTRTQTEPWSKIAEEISPVFDTRIEQMYSSK